MTTVRLFQLLITPACQVTRTDAAIQKEWKTIVKKKLQRESRESNNPCKYWNVIITHGFDSAPERKSTRQEEVKSFLRSVPVICVYSSDLWADWWTTVQPFTLLYHSQVMYCTVLLYTHYSTIQKTNESRPCFKTTNMFPILCCIIIADNRDKVMLLVQLFICLFMTK